MILVTSRAMKFIIWLVKISEGKVAKYRLHFFIQILGWLRKRALRTYYFMIISCVSIMGVVSLSAFHLFFSCSAIFVFIGLLLKFFKSFMNLPVEKAVDAEVWFKQQALSKLSVFNRWQQYSRSQVSCGSPNWVDKRLHSRILRRSSDSGARGGKYRRLWHWKQ